MRIVEEEAYQDIRIREAELCVRDRLWRRRGYWDK